MLFGTEKTAVVSADLTPELLLFWIENVAVVSADLVPEPLEISSCDGEAEKAAVLPLRLLLVVNVVLAFLEAFNG